MGTILKSTTNKYFVKIIKFPLFLNMPRIISTRTKIRIRIFQCFMSGKCPKNPLSESTHSLNIFYSIKTMTIWIFKFRNKAKLQWIKSLEVLEQVHNSQLNFQLEFLDSFDSLRQTLFENHRLFDGGFCNWSVIRLTCGRSSWTMIMLEEPADLEFVL